GEQSSGSFCGSEIRQRSYGLPPQTDCKRGRPGLHSSRRPERARLMTSPGIRRRLALVRLGRDAKTDLIKSVPLFVHCSRGQLAEIAGIADELDLADGKQLMTQGDRGREFFVLLDGTADVTQDGERINQLGPGDFFGEIALVWQAPRTATVTMTS